MKRLSFIICALVVSFLLAAQLNYLAAIQDAKNSEGSDAAIEQAMFNHGFKVDAMDTRPISFIQKIKAILP